MFKYRKIGHIILLAIFCSLLTSCNIWHKLKQFVGIEKVHVFSNYTIQEIDLLLKTGNRFKGIPYRTGGMDERGMDCSGLLYKIYQVHGYQIPRLSIDQSNFGLPVSIANIQVGDWIFFRTNNSRIVNHSGIVTATKGGFDIQFLHSSTSKGVREDNLLTRYWSNALYKVIRPFKN